MATRQTYVEFNEKITMADHDKEAAINDQDFGKAANLCGPGKASHDSKDDAGTAMAFRRP